jgi:hypothetical protein
MQICFLERSFCASSAAGRLKKSPGQSGYGPFTLFHPGIPTNLCACVVKFERMFTQVLLMLHYDEAFGMGTDNRSIIR